ncbi:MAG TPA: cupin domain-containing protein [Bacteroidota bacterium]|nr:cupin domain-containing protein [Bacteroidota bacterium]
MRSGLVTLHAGQDVGSHSTGNHEEMLVILGGVGEVEVEGAGRRRIREGMVAYIPPHTEHNVFNIEDFPLRYIYIVARAE